MGKVKKKITPNQKKILTADALYDKRMARLKKEGYIFPYYLTKPTHPKRITQEYIDNYNENISRKNLKSYAIGKRYRVSKNLDPTGKHTRILYEPPGLSKIKGTKEEKLEFVSKHKFKQSIKGKAIPQEFLDYDAVIEHENLLRSFDYNPHDHPTTSRWMTDTEQNITYRAIIKQLKSFGTFPFADWLLNVIEDKIQLENVSKEDINIALSKMQGYGIVITREMLYDKEATGDYARALISMLPLSMEESSRLYAMVDEFISVGEEEIG